MQDKIMYPFNSLTANDLIKAGKRIKYYYKDDTLNFKINKKELEDSNQIYISTLAYIKLLTNLVGKKKNNQLEEINRIISIIRSECIDAITDLQIVEIEKIIKVLNIKDSKDNRALLSLVIKGYEIENDVEITNNKNYNVVPFKKTDSMGLEKNKVLLLASGEMK